MISAELGLPVEKHDDGSSPGMYDLTIDPQGRCGAVEGHRLRGSGVH
jgi:hypothetical protein